MSALNAVQEKYDKQSLELQEAKRISDHFQAQLAEMKDMVRQVCTREGQKFPATIFFLFTWVHLYKSGSIYIKYEPLSFMPCNMNSIARLVALRHYHKDNAF